MTVAQQADERDRQLEELADRIEAIMPGPVSHQQRCFIENALVLNLNQVDS
jgi:hypothetical protein